MRRQLLPAVRMLVLLTVFTGILYTFAITGIAQGVFRSRADGSLIERKGQVVGSRLIGQAFASPRYFHPRPSAAGPHGYDPMASGASNLGPSNPALLRLVAHRAAAVRADNGLPSDAAVPVDAVTASGSGLDPDISVAYARLQAARAARVRGLDPAVVRKLVDTYTRGRTLGFLGEKAVNVLELNLALDRLD